METIRMKMETEIDRCLDRLKDFDPKSEEYQKVVHKIVQLSELINKEDEVANKLKVDTGRLDAEKDLEAIRQGSESEKLRLEVEKVQVEQDQRKRETIRAYILTGISSLVTLGTFVGTWIFNARAQARSEYFEETGHAYTSRFSRFQLKEPSHPNVKT